jgi:threonyl-tRNA synthetase
VLPIADAHLDYAQRCAQLARPGFGRSRRRQEKIGYKIREAQLQKVPYMLVVGDREAAEGPSRCAPAGDSGARPEQFQMAAKGAAARAGCTAPRRALQPRRT